MPDNTIDSEVEYILLEHDRSVFAAGSAYGASLASEIRQGTIIQIKNLIAQEAVAARMDEVTEAQKAWLDNRLTDYLKNRRAELIKGGRNNA